jgi:hypothetical protein
MKYFPKGWNIFKFLVSPPELTAIIKEYHHIEFGRRVPANYIESDPIEFFNKYKIFYDKLVSNYKFTKEIDFDLSNLMIGLSNDLSKCTYDKEFMDKNNKIYYKLSNFKEPCVGINIVVLRFDKNKKLFSNLSFTQFPENIIGLEIHYPKELYYYEKVNSEIIIKETINCNKIETYNSVYIKIMEDIKRISKNLVFAMDGKEYKTTIKVSKSIMEDVKNIYFIKSNKCIIK